MIVALEWLMGCFMSLSCIILWFALPSLASSVPLSRLLVFIAVVTLVTMLTISTFLIGQAVRNGREWAWNASVALFLLVSGFGAWSLYDLFYGKVHGPDDYFALIYGPALILYALIGMILLALPSTRGYFANGALADSCQALL